jgi:hypothetical protein
MFGILGWIAFGLIVGVIAKLIMSVIGAVLLLLAYRTVVRAA